MPERRGARFLPAIAYEERQQQDELAAEALRLRAEQQQLRRIDAMTELRSQMVREAANTAKIQMQAGQLDRAERDSVAVMDILSKIEDDDPMANRIATAALARYPGSMRSANFNQFIEPRLAVFKAAQGFRMEQDKEVAAWSRENGIAVPRDARGLPDWTKAGQELSKVKAAMAVGQGLVPTSTKIAGVDYGKPEPGPKTTVSTSTLEVPGEPVSTMRKVTTTGGAGTVAPLSGTEFLGSIGINRPAPQVPAPIPATTNDELPTVRAFKPGDEERR